MRYPARRWAERPRRIVLACSRNPAALAVGTGRANNDADFEVCHSLFPLIDTWEQRETAIPNIPTPTAPVPYEDFPLKVVLAAIPGFEPGF